MRANLFWTRSLTSTQKTQVQLFDRKGREDIKDELQRPSSLGYSDSSSVWVRHFKAVGMPKGF
jgi:hypothetical protein